MHVCPMSDGPKPHVGGLIIPPGPSNVFIGGQPAAAVGYFCTCVSAAPDSIAVGSSSVYINNLQAARQGDQTAHGGKITVGCPNVMIGG